MEPAISISIRRSNGTDKDLVRYPGQQRERIRENIMDNSSTPQQEISSETTPAQETTQPVAETTQSTPSTPATGTPATPEAESWEYKGDRKDVPAPFKKYVEALDRYVSKKDQTVAEARKKAEDYEKFVQSEDYKLFQQFKTSQPRGVGPTESPAPTVSQEEAEAIALGDVNTLAKVIKREAERVVETKVGPKEAEIQKRFEAMDLKEKQIQNAEMIQAFAETNKDFWELYDNGFEDYIVNSIKSGRSLEDTYKKAKFIESKIAEREETKRRADYEKKKSGSVVGKSIPGTPDVVFADDERHAKRLAIELTLKGDKRHVQIKPKK